MSFWHPRYSDPNKRQSVTTTPIADNKVRFALSGTLLKLALMAALPIGALHYYGQPALRFQYNWNGNHQHPIYYRCHYITLFNGWRDVHPRYGYCPLITTFPFELSHLTGE